ncbi:uncharacterized protein LOC129594547 [Paramacrobiotus metropolitanus]|uniref:uncharacterized protein LOC129594547 n=1 Tax=Paramacrobiotus metropolitanus TaxID=2943436 RepID=UPI002445B34F|nr:uncharacterized protein LOC129594547 [Paramacrobiotus metropolitanus]
MDPITAANATRVHDDGSPSIGFTIWSSASVFLMIPGLSLFYSGLSRYNNALSLMMLCMLSCAIVSIQFFLFGFSLAFSETGSLFIGDFRDGALGTLGIQPLSSTSPNIPSIAFMLYQMQFAAITAALIFGSVPERTRFVPAMLFIFAWTTLVYDVVAYWSWAKRGWIRNLACVGQLTDMSRQPCLVGGYDFAGGGPVHVASGFAGLAYCIMIGKRKKIHQEHHSLVNVMLGTGLLWCGWFGFNGGSEGAADTRAAMASAVTTLGAASGGLTWAWFDYMWTRKLSALSFCSGVVAGLVGVTPGSGFVAPWAGVVTGILTAFFCNMWCRLKKRFGFDDSFDAWSVHGSGGFLGSLLTAIFAQKWIGEMDGEPFNGGWLEQNWIQMWYQFAGSAAIAIWSFFVSLFLLFIINKLPGCRLRQSQIDELVGGDFAEMGEVGYLLVISEPEADDSPGDTRSVGVLKDGRRVSVIGTGDKMRSNSVRSHHSHGNHIHLDSFRISKSAAKKSNGTLEMNGTLPRRDSENLSTITEVHPSVYSNH